LKSSFETLHHRSKAKSVLVFATHQFAATIGILLLANLATGLAFDVIRLFSGRVYSIGYSYWILSGTPYFPVQIALGLVLGWILGRWLRHRSMLWVWVLPALALGLAFVALPQVSSLTLQARLSHFFGWGCRPENHCSDQLGITLPLYSAISYSFGALLARMSRPTSHLARGMAD